MLESVNPLYYVAFTSAVLCASFILFQGFNTTDTVNTVSLLCGFFVIFAGVYLLNLSSGDPDGRRLLKGRMEDGVPTDTIAAITTRRSMQSRRSVEPHRMSNGSLAFSPRSPGGDREPFIQAYDVENGGFGLSDLAEDSEEEMDAQSKLNGKPITNGKAIASRLHDR